MSELQPRHDPEFQHFPSLETIARESQSDVAATKTYQLNMKETVARRK